MPRILAGVTLNLVISASRAGLDSYALLDQLGLSLAELMDRDARIPADKHLALATELLRRSPDTNLGLSIGTCLSLEHLGVLGFVFSNAPDLRAGIESFVRYQGFLTDLVSWQLDDDEGGLRLRLRPHENLPRAVPVEAAMAGILTLSRELVGDFSPLHVSYRHASRGPAQEHASFWRCPVEFEATHNQITLSHDVLARPLANAKSEVREPLERHIEAVLAAEPPGDALGRAVRRELATRLGQGDATQATVARALGMSARSLSRKLAAEGSSFRSALTQVRRELAMRYLADPSLAVYEVAFLLGYSEPSTFHRAFKSWTTETPASYRARHGA